MKAATQAQRILTAEQLAFWQSQGYLLIENFVEEAECKALRQRAAELVEALDEEKDKARFSTSDEEANSNAYFLDSGDKVRIFMEAENAEVPNKLGHALHQKDEVFRNYSGMHKAMILAREIGFEQPEPVQSMYIFKNPGFGGTVDPHQDSTFLYTEPMSVVGFWLAIENADQENGCLWVIPGGHQEPLRKRMIRDGKGGVTFTDLDPRPLPMEGYVPVEVPAGCLVLLHGLLPHYSLTNRSERSRNAYAVHIVEGKAEYPAENWLRMPS